METIANLLKQLQEEKYHKRIADIYGTGEGVLEEQIQRYRKALEKYRSLFGDGPVEVYSAPGRTEIGGNHTDHQHGMVLAASVNLDTIVVVGVTDENIIELVSEGYKPVRVEIKDTEANKEEYGTTAALVKGVAAGIRKNGWKTGGFRAYMTSNVLNGAGLSSSAAFESVLGTVFSGLYNEGKISPVEIAVIGQYAENVYFGKPCGLMDQMACSVGNIIQIDFKNPSEPIVEKLEFELSNKQYSLCIVDTRGSHADLTDDYAAIPKEMREVAAFFGKEVLREVPPEEFYEKLPLLYKKKGDRRILRAIHFFAENQRVIEETSALKEDRFDDFLSMVKASGDSSYKFLQNIYSNRQVQNQSVSLGLALSEKVLGENGVCRVHGGGFAGTIQAFVKNTFVEKYREEMDRFFGEGSCHILKIRKYGGIKVL